MTVRLLYDWLGSQGTRGGYWRALRDGGVEVRRFNRLRIADLFGKLAWDPDYDPKRERSRDR